MKLLQKLPLDLSLDGRKEQLRKSELGKYIMFYSKLPDEILTNRQLARGLVEKWSRPIFEQFRESAADDELQVGRLELPPDVIPALDPSYAQLRSRRTSAD